MTDVEDPLAGLMVRYQAGDVDAFDEVYRLTAGSVEGYMSRWTDRTGRADLVQETFLQVHRARRTFRPDLPFKPWLFAIARHVAMGAARTRKRRWAKEIGMDEYPETAGARDSEKDVFAREQIDAAIAKLPKDQQEVVWLARIEGMTSTEISKITGASAGAIKVRLHRANKKLRVWLEDLAPQAEASGDG